MITFQNQFSNNGGRTPWNEVCEEMLEVVAKSKADAKRIREVAEDGKISRRLSDYAQELGRIDYIMNEVETLTRHGYHQKALINSVELMLAFDSLCALLASGGNPRKQGGLIIYESPPELKQVHRPLLDYGKQRIEEVRQRMSELCLGGAA